MLRQTKIVNMSVPMGLYSQVDKMAKKRDTSRSQILKEALRVYIDEEMRWQQIKSWGRTTAKKFKFKSEEDIERIRENYLNG